MKKLLALLLLLPATVFADYYGPLKYGDAANIPFILLNDDGSISADETDGGSDVQVFCGPGDTPAASTNDFVVDGESYYVALTAAEMQCEFVKLEITGTFQMTIVQIPTQGGASAAIENFAANVGEVFGSSTAADNMATAFTGTITSFDGLDTAQDTQHAATQADIATVDSNVDAILVDTGTTLDGKINTIDTNVDAILVDTGTTLDGKINTIDTNVDAILVDTGTTLPGTLSTIDGIVDDILVDTGTTLVSQISATDAVADAIKVKTDQMTFTVTNELDTNVKSMNDVTLQGNGTSGNKWRGQ